MNMNELDQLLIEKHDELEECQEALEKAKRELNGLRVENEAMNADLDKAELMLEEYYEKI